MQKETKIETNLREQIRDERHRQTQKTIADVCDAITRGEAVSATGNLLFHTSCETFRDKLDSILEKLSTEELRDTERLNSLHMHSVAIGSLKDVVTKMDAFKMVADLARDICSILK